MVGTEHNQVAFKPALNGPDQAGVNFGSGFMGYVFIPTLYYKNHYFQFINKLFCRDLIIDGLQLFPSGF